MKIHLTLFTLSVLTGTALSTDIIADETPEKAQPTRIEVYSISQFFWDVSPGETLGEIIQRILPDSQAQRAPLLRQILNLNPHAFVQANPNRLKANVRLWLPNNTSRNQRKKDKNKYQSQSFSWGQIHKVKR